MVSQEDIINIIVLFVTIIFIFSCLCVGLGFVAELLNIQPYSEKINVEVTTEDPLPHTTQISNAPSGSYSIKIEVKFLPYIRTIFDDKFYTGAHGANYANFTIRNSSTELLSFSTSHLSDIFQPHTIPLTILQKNNLTLSFMFLISDHDHEFEASWNIEIREKDDIKQLGENFSQNFPKALVVACFTGFLLFLFDRYYSS